MKSLMLIFSLFISTNLFGQKGNITQCRWHNNDKTESSDYQLLKKAKLFYILSNDKENFYINLKVEDKEVQNRILTEGLTIWINMEGNSLKNMGVRFPMGSQNQTTRKKSDHFENNPNRDESQANLVSMANTIEIIGFINEQERHFPSENSDNFRGSVKIDQAGVLLYKMVMPIAKLPVRNSKNGNGAMPFSIGIEYGSSPGLNKPAENRGPAPSSAFRTARKRSGTSELNWINNVKLATSK